MNSTICDKCGRKITNNNYKRHYASCDGTFFLGPANPNKPSYKRKPKKEVQKIREKSLKKARKKLIETPPWNKGKRKYSENEIFCVGTYNKIYLVKEMYIAKIGYFCEICSLKEWNGVPITLDLDHINGNSDDNRIENLRLLCPNCHSQTPTYKNKNGGGVKKVSDTLIISAIETSANIHQVLLKTGLKNQGTHYKRVKRVIKKYNLTPSW